MHPELFLLLYQQRERQLEQLHARRAAAVERFESTPTPRGVPTARPVGRRHAVSAALSSLAARVRAASSSPAATPTCCPAV